MLLLRPGDGVMGGLHVAAAFMWMYSFVLHSVQEVPVTAVNR